MKKGVAWRRCVSFGGGSLPNPSRKLEIFPCAFELTQAGPRSGHRIHLTYVESRPSGHGALNRQRSLETAVQRRTKCPVSRNG